MSGVHFQLVYNILSFPMVCMCYGQVSVGLQDLVVRSGSHERGAAPAGLYILSFALVSMDGGQFQLVYIILLFSVAFICDVHSQLVHVILSFSVAFMSDGQFQLAYNILPFPLAFMSGGQFQSVYTSCRSRWFP